MILVVDTSKHTRRFATPSHRGSIANVPFSLISNLPEAEILG